MNTFEIKSAAQEVVDLVKVRQAAKAASEAEFLIGSLATLIVELADRVANLETAVRFGAPTDKRHPLQD